MPIYLFVCKHCNKHFERIMSFSDTDLPKCEECGKSEVYKKLTAHNSYNIKGDNSASTPPRRFRSKS